MHKHPPPISGGYWRRLKKKESSKGFTLVELIVVIVILAILAAILIPGLLKWIDQAKDKKYELEAREISLAAEAAIAKVYADGIEVQELYYGPFYFDATPGVDYSGNTNFMDLDTFAQEIEKLTDANVIYINPIGSGWNAGEYVGQFRPWEGSVTGFDIYFVSDEVKIHAYYLGGPEVNNSGPRHIPTDGWEITKDPSEWGYWDW